MPVVISNTATLDVPPPGVGFTTVTKAVPTAAMSEAGTAAVIWVELTKVVVRGLPFYFTTDAAASPDPLMVNVKAGPPGAAVAGTRGGLIWGTG